KQKHVQQISLKIRNFQGICDAHVSLRYSIIRLILKTATALSAEMMCNGPVSLISCALCYVGFSVIESSSAEICNPAPRHCIHSRR
ncbi:hypothetical protein, partial [Gemmiger sp.]